MKNNSIYLLLIFILASAETQAQVQVQNPIIYLLPDSVEMVLNKEIATYKHKKVYFIMNRWCENSNNHRCIIWICQFKGEIKNNFAINTNRFIIVNKEKYPVYFDYDIDFHLRKSRTLGEFGERYGDARIEGNGKTRTALLFHGTTVSFDYNTGGNVKTSYELYRPKYPVKERKLNKKKYIKLFAQMQQVQDSIIYVMPDSVEVELYNYISTLTTENVYFIMGIKGYGDKYYYDTNYFITICTYDKKSDLVENTNRFILVNDSKYPVYFDYDINFYLTEKQKNRLVKFGDKFSWHLMDRNIYNEEMCYYIIFRDKAEEIIEKKEKRK